MGYFDFDATTEWLKLKWGQFSASECHQLTVKGRKGEMFGDGALTYIKKIARQRMSIFNTDDKVESFDMRMGKMREAECAAYYKRCVGLDNITHYGDANPVFEMYKKLIGASPDALAVTDSGKVSFGAEFKNPKASTHFDYLCEITNQQDLLEKEPYYYGQCQCSMLVFNCDLWHWSSYDQYQINTKNKMVLIEVTRDKKYLDDLEIRLVKANKMVTKAIEMMQNGHQGKIRIEQLM